MKQLLWISIFGLLASCGSPPLELSKATEADIPSTFAYKGEAVDIRTWTDGNGKNVLLLTRSELSHEDTALSVALFAYHLLAKEDTFELLRMERRSERNCRKKNLAFFSEQIHLTDLDKDGIGEITFAHYGGCADTEIPLPVRLVMLEGGDIFIIRGTTRIASGEGGKKRVEYSFFFCPPEFLTHANHLWRSYTYLISAST